MQFLDCNTLQSCFQKELLRNRYPTNMRSGRTTRLPSPAVEDGERAIGLESRANMMDNTHNMYQ